MPPRNGQSTSDRLEGMPAPVVIKFLSHPRVSRLLQQRPMLRDDPYRESLEWLGSVETSWTHWRRAQLADERGMALGEKWAMQRCVTPADMRESQSPLEAAAWACGSHHIELRLTPDRALPESATEGCYD